jgi:hypothetical protein
MAKYLIRHCCVAPTLGTLKWRLAIGSDRQGQLVERNSQPPARWLLYRQLVVTASKVLHQRMPGDNHPGTAVLLETAHWSQSSLQPAVVALDPVVGVLVGAVPCRWQQRLQHAWVDRRLIVVTSEGVTLVAPIACLKNLRAAPHVPTWGDEHIDHLADHLAELVDRSVYVAPPSGDLHIRLIHLPAVAYGMPAAPSGVGQQRREAQHSPVNGDVVNLDTPLGEEFLDVAVGQAEAQVPADGDDDDLGWEPEAGEGGPRDTSGTRAASSHGASLAARRAHGERNSALATLRLRRLPALVTEDCFGRAGSGQCRTALAVHTVQWDPRRPAPPLSWPELAATGRSGSR